MSEISREKNRLEILLHNMSDGVISFSKDGELMLANAAGRGDAWSGKNRNEFYGIYPCV